jgi:hypothetical protein
MSHVTIAVGPTPPKNPPKQKSGAAIGLSTVESRRRNVASAPAKGGAKPARAPRVPRVPRAAKPAAPAPAPTPAVEPEITDAGATE